MDARTIELNRIGDLLKKAFDGRYNNEPLSNHQKPVSVVPNRDFALKQFEFAKIAKKPISQTRVQKPADLESYWSESTIDLIRKLVKEREQYKQNSEFVNAQLNNNSSDAANNKEIVKLKQELQTFETIKKQNAEMDNVLSQLNDDNNKLKTQNEELQTRNDAYKNIINSNAIEKFKINKANETLATELKKCNEINESFITDYDEYTAEVDKTQNKFKENINLLTEELKQKNAEIGQLKTSNKLVEQENKFKLEKAQMDIMFGMKMDLIKKQFENTIANISNSSNADLIKQNNNLTTEKQTYNKTIDDFNQTIRKNEEDIERLKDENAKLSSETQKQETEKLLNETQKQAMSSQANTDKEKLAQLQTRVMKLTQELLIIKMNEDLQKQKYANFKPTAAPTKLDRNTFAKREFVGINMAGGSPKQKLFMKGGASKEFLIDFNDDEEILVIFNKSNKSIIQTPNVPQMTYCTVEMITEYNKKLKDLKDENDSLKKSSQSSVATPNSDAMKTLTEKLIALQTLYKDSQNNLRNEQIKNALNSSIQSTLKSSLTNANAIADLTKEKDNLKADKSKLEAENDALTKAIEDLTKEKDALKTEKADLTSANTSLEGEKTGLTSAKTNLEAKNKQLQGEKTSLEGEKTRLETEITGLKNQLNSTSTLSGMSTAISNANATLRRIPKGFISDNGNVMFLEHK